MTRNIIPSASTDTTRISIPNLPPPYTFTGVRPEQTRANISDFTTTSTILVGPELTPFKIHTTLLTSKSSYFRAALNGPLIFIESETNSIKLDNVPVEHFQLLVSWLYDAILPTPFKNQKPAYYTLLHVYALADRLGLEGARNAVVEVISDLADGTNSVLTPSDTRILYEEIRDSAPIRTLVLDLFAFKKTDRLLDSHGDWWHEEFLRDLTAAYVVSGVVAYDACVQSLWHCITA
ncbi:hypothetical protein G6011_11405 [Alternaria panax]|uniref:BTB domain-containing protein n=1 Tax=Alternaria panax TaxID=48097 RepID=A0AAD4IDC4_9PLEO|nr:hypothetical protein G6011_11405 [Alternaria panax]